jgi:hypothetical protein
MDFVISATFLLKSFRLSSTNLEKNLFLLLSSYTLSLRSILFGTVAAVLGTVLPAYSCLATSTALSIFLCILSMLFWRVLRNKIIIYG